MRCRENRDMSQLRLDLARQRVNLCDPVYLIPEKLNPVRIAARIRRVYLQYISEAAVLNDFAAAEGLENVSVERFIQYYQEGNPNARKVMQDFTHYIGISLNTVLHTFNPDVIVINSSFTNYIPGLIDEITSGIQNRLRWYLHVLPAHLQDVSVLMGGISLCSRNFLGISTFKLLDL